MEVFFYRCCDILGHSEMEYEHQQADLIHVFGCSREQDALRAEVAEITDIPADAETETKTQDLPDHSESTGREAAVSENQENISVDTSIECDKIRGSCRDSEGSTEADMEEGWNQAVSPPHRLSSVSSKTISTGSGESSFPDSSNRHPESLGDDGVVDFEFTDPFHGSYRHCEYHLTVDNPGVYEGQVQEDKPITIFHGRGRYVGPKWTYIGEWADGQMHGDGTQTWEDGHSYTGQFRQGSLSGHGTATWRHPNGNMVYVGEYQDDNKHGFGKFTWASGRTYEGEWRNGERHGIGVDTNAKGIETRGMWRAGRFLYAVDCDDEPLEKMEQVVKETASSPRL